jgi:hypothetical protein
MKRIANLCLVTWLPFVFLTTHAQNWKPPISSGGYSHPISLDKSGNYYTLSTGFTTYTYQNNSYTTTIGTVQKFNSNGNFVRSFGHFGNYSKYLVDDKENVFIIGHDISLDSVRPVLCKYDSTGIRQWSIAIGTTTYGAVIETISWSAKGILVGGDWTLYAGQWAGFYDSFVARVSHSGTLDFVYRFPGNNYDHVEGTMAEPDGTFYVSGSYQTTFCDSVKTITSYNPNNYGRFLLKYTPSGILQWAKGIDNRVNTYSLRRDANGNVCFGNNHLQPDKHIAILVFDTAANLQQYTILAPSGDHSGITNIQFDSNNNLYACGYFHDSLLLPGKRLLTSKFDDRWYFLKRNPSGNIEASVYAPTAFGSFDLQGCEMGFQLIYADSIVLGNYKFKRIGGSIITGTRCDELVGVSEPTFLENKIGIYPNPNTGSFHVSVGEKNIGNIIHVTNLLGESFYQHTIVSPEFDVFCKESPPGIYIVSIDGGTVKSHKKIIVNK